MERENLFEQQTSPSGEVSKTDILEYFSPEDQEEIVYKQEVLSSLAYFIGNDIDVSIGLNESGGGWYWDSEENVIMMDPQDLLEMPMDYLRFTISHEAGHRRITRMSDAQMRDRQKAGFSFLMNMVEASRVNNFVVEAYPRFYEQLKLAYQIDLEQIENFKGKTKEVLGYTPYFIQASLEYMRLWYEEVKGKGNPPVDDNLPKEVQEVVIKTRESVRDSWLRYPSKEEVDSGEEIIKQYAELSYMINREEVWPVFKELVDFDMQNQEIQQLLQNKEIQKELGEVVGDLDLLSEEWREKLMEYIQSLSKKDQEELKREAKEALAEIEEQTGEWLIESIYNNIAESVEAFELSKGLSEETLDSDEGIYERERRNVLPLIDKLETDLRDVFVKRRKQGWLSGFKRGKRIDIQKRMQEEARSIPVVDSKSWQRRELPQEMGYAISLLVDLSGSMERDKKIGETFKAVIVLAEVLNRLSIRTEILGFNEDLYVYQRFGQHMNDDIRKQMGKMLTEVLSTKAMHNDDGWAVQEASERLAKQNAEKKFLFVLSDGIPNESRKHPRSEYDLGNIVKEIIKNTDQKIIGLGVGEGTEDMKKYYPNHQVDIKVEQLAEKLANTIREVLVNYDSF